MEIERYITYDDQKLVQLVLEGDNIAFEHLFNRYRDSITKLYLQKTFGNVDDTNDLLQETFVKVYLNMHKYNRNYTFGQWLYTIARNTFIDYIRKRREVLPIDNINISDGIYLDPNPEENYIRAQQQKQLDFFLAKMKPKYRTLIELRFFKELTYEEISEKLNIPMGTVKTQIHRAREQLCRFITDHTDILP